MIIKIVNYFNFLNTTLIMIHVISYRERVNLILFENCRNYEDRCLLSLVLRHGFFTQHERNNYFYGLTQHEFFLKIKFTSNFKILKFN